MQFQERIRLKKGREKIIMLTAYDYQMAKILDRASLDLILVGDSLGMVVQGHSNTKKVTMDDMIYHARAVARGARTTPIIGDMPINSYNRVGDSLKSARRFLEAGAHGVKIEGNRPKIVQALTEAEIPVMGHVGMLPQLADRYHVVGKEPQEAEQILEDAKKLADLNVFSIVLECIPEQLARQITQQVRVPTIGIGAGRFCDGQVLVVNDMLGLDQCFKPKFVKRYANLSEVITNAITEFKGEVINSEYPDEEHTYH